MVGHFVGSLDGAGVGSAVHLHPAQLCPFSVRYAHVHVGLITKSPSQFSLYDLYPPSVVMGHVSVGEGVGASVGGPDSGSVGLFVGTFVGSSVGSADSGSVGLSVGAFVVGDWLGLALGDLLGLALGNLLGLALGDLLGLALGDVLGIVVGARVLPGTHTVSVSAVHSPPDAMIHEPEHTLHGTHGVSEAPSSSYVDVDEHGVQAVAGTPGRAFVSYPGPHSRHALALLDHHHPGGHTGVRVGSLVGWADSSPPWEVALAGIAVKNVVRRRRASTAMIFCDR